MNMNEQLELLERLAKVLPMGDGVVFLRRRALDLRVSETEWVALRIDSDDTRNMPASFHLLALLASKGWRWSIGLGQLGDRYCYLERGIETPVMETAPTITEAVVRAALAALEPSAETVGGDLAGTK